ncbi:PRA1 family protein H [Silene latifolia]|uniref:PRA1 family protein H n=1 Tax=Silene latifolia TaxID=37657 RepID=UPI003D78965A
MSFKPNPLSLSLSDPNFESWLRDSGYLELLDHRTTQLHNLHASTSSTHSTTTPTTTTTAPTTTNTTRTTTKTTITAISYTLTMSLISSLATILSLFTLNPFAKLNSSDFTSNNENFSVMNSINWTNSGFLGCFDSYSFPSSPTQARMRVHENVKRFARQYAVLSLVIFCCSLYKMPLAFVGLLSCLAVWELFRFCDAKWALERYPSSRQVLIRAGQCGVAAILFWCNVQAAIFCTVVVSYAVLIMHASFRKLTPAKQPVKGRRR